MPSKRYLESNMDEERDHLLNQYDVAFDGEGTDEDRHGRVNRKHDLGKLSVTRGAVIDLYWSWVPGLPRKLYWPVRVISWDGLKVKVFCKADNAILQFCSEYYSKSISDETDINENADDPMIDAGELKDDEGVSKTIKSENCCIYDSGKSGEISYENALKQIGYGKFHILLLALCGWAVSSDAIEVLSVSFMLPSAECDLHLTSQDKGWLNAIIFVGMMVGGYFWGSMADKFGRRSVLMGSLAVNGIGGLISSTSQVFWLFLIMRFISGVGVGGSIPVIFSYFTEFLPRYRRGSLISALATFWMMGNIIAAGLAWIVIPHPHLGYISDSFKYNSWRIFVAICTIPSLSSAVMFFFMPESPKFFLTRGRVEKAMHSLRVVQKINNGEKQLPFSTVILTTDTGDVVYVEDNDENHSFIENVNMLISQTKKLFGRSLFRVTVIMLVINFTLSFGYYGLWMWFPEIFARVEKYGGSPCTHIEVNQTSSSSNCTGIPEDWVFFEGFMTALSNLPGNIVTILIMDKIGRKPLLASSMVISGITVFFLPFVHTKYENLAISCVFGAVSTIGWNSLDVLQAELFPTSVRSTAFGLQSGLGRIAAICGNVVFGSLVDVHCAVPMIMVAALLMIGGLSAIKLPNTTGKDIH